MINTIIILIYIINFLCFLCAYLLCVLFIVICIGVHIFSCFCYWPSDCWLVVLKYTDWIDLNSIIKWHSSHFDIQLYRLAGSQHNKIKRKYKKQFCGSWWVESPVVQNIKICCVLFGLNSVRVREGCVLDRWYEIWE